MAQRVFFFFAQFFLASSKSNPVKSNEFLPSNKFTRRQPLLTENVRFGVDASGLHTNRECPMPISLVWTNELDSSIYATPVIDRLSGRSSISEESSGKSSNSGERSNKHILIPEFRGHLSLLDNNGHLVNGWPVEVTDEDVSFHTSPLLGDFDDDGYEDMIWISVNAQMFMVNGKTNIPKLIYQIPKLRVKKRWYEEDEAEQKHGSIKKNINIEEEQNPATRNLLHARTSLEGQINKVDQRNIFTTGNRLKNSPHDMPPITQTEDNANSPNNNNGARQSRRLLQADSYRGLDELFSDTEDEILAHQQQHQSGALSDFVDVDPHVLASPVAVDLNNDGSLEIIVALSYYFDREMYTNHPERFAHLDHDVDLEMYVAGGVLVYDVRRNATTWNEQLDLTTDLTDLRAHIYSAPTVIDLDGDGDFEVIVGTSLGYIHVLDAHTGEARAGFPIHMAEIQAQVTVEDVNGDGALELIAADVIGNVMCFDRNGIEVWETQVSGFVSQGATFGDVNGDGVMDVVVGTVSGHVWVLRGDTGLVLPGFPLKTDDRILAPITLVNLDSLTQIQAVHLEFMRRTIGGLQTGQTLQSIMFPINGSNAVVGSGFGLHLVFPSFDGHVYIVDGRTGCANKLDISEHAYGMVLADDVLDNGKMALVVTTQNGNVYCFATEAPYHPMKTWSSQAQGVNGFTARHGYHGIFIIDYPTNDIVGPSFDLTFEIVDERPKVKKHEKSGKYVVTIGLNGIDPSGAKPDDSLVRVSSRHIIFRKFYNRPGRYTEKINCPRIPHRAVLHLHMWNEHLQYFQDSADMSFNVHYYRILKYLVLGPILISVGIYAVLEPRREAILPLRD